MTTPADQHEHEHGHERTPPVLRINDLSLRFEGQDEDALHGVRIAVERGQFTAVVGESGCGKTITALSVLRLLPSPPARITGGTIELNGENLLERTERAMREVRGGEIAMIFQEPMTALNPVYTIGEQIIEAIQLHRSASRRAATTLAINALREVGITEPEQRLRSYPHEFSGGMRQRVMIAMALACEPRVLLADEPTTALDVSTQRQILLVLERLQRERDLAILFITHDLALVEEHADAVYVMHSGRMIECAAASTVFARPMHPYTKALLLAAPRLDQERPRLRTVDALLADAHAFAPFDSAQPALTPWWGSRSASEPVLAEIAPQHWVACEATPEAGERSKRFPAMPRQALRDAMQ